MKLIDILVGKGDGMELFGVHTKYLAMDPDGRVYGYTEIPTPGVIGWSVPGNSYSTDGRGCLIQIDRDDVDGQWQSAIITREQYEAALAAKNEGWIEWDGGECPVPCGTIFDVKHRCGAVSENQQAWPKRHKESHIMVNPLSNAGQAFWRHENSVMDIIAYRLHQPKKSEQVRADAWNAYAGITEPDGVADLNECIGQSPVPLWNGEGLPPVGCVCERSWAGDEWLRCEILFMSHQIVVVKLKESGIEDAYHIGDVAFRQVSPERTEAEIKREEAVKAITLTGWCQDFAEEIYDLVAAGKVPGMKLED